MPRSTPVRTRIRLGMRQASAVDAGAAPLLCVVERAGSRGRGARYDRMALDAPAGAAITGRGNGGLAAVAAA